MKLRILTLALVMVAVAANASAQGPKGQPGGENSRLAPGNCVSNPLDMAHQQAVEGVITSLEIGYGVQYPSIVVNKLQIKLAPVWFLIDNDMELSVGETVKLTAVPSTAADAYLYAIDIAKTNPPLKLILRDSAGLPLWIASARSGRNPGNGNPQAQRSGEGCLDPASFKTAIGVIDHVAAGIGIRQPLVVLKSGDTLLTIKIGPERVLLNADFELKAGMTLTVKYALATCTDEFVALEISDGAGRTIVLRNPDGSPAWND